MCKKQIVTSTWHEAWAFHLKIDFSNLMSRHRVSTKQDSRVN